MVNALEMQVAGPVPTKETFKGLDANILEQYEQYFDNVTGEELPQDEVRKACETEIGWVRSINLYDKVPRSVAQERGIKPLPVRVGGRRQGRFLAAQDPQSPGREGAEGEDRMRCWRTSSSVPHLPGRRSRRCCRCSSPTA